ncbi:hypothetical protein CROQUDRAFT_653095 [Cronartium quercuum f. sp. fusiforme G11]|uniref:RING-type domain-containing protein n=1 Tax=Cronartium quercuum f. sp. fusiforme G11 TaxID=708437 RepID=A0A9P6NPH4_9BASI|nr:hypothetical protein CROQUDRAFT_653095 [Cronartium quercuum f. sp. fusiforme G11]
MSRVRILPTCSICHDETSPEPYVTTLCGHIFHSPCIRRWDQTQHQQKIITKCPTCCSVLKRIAPEKSRAQLGSRFVTLHSLTERTIDRASSPAISESSHSQDTNRLSNENKELMNVVCDQRHRIKELEALPVKLRAENVAIQTQLDRIKRELEQARRHELETISEHRKSLAVEKKCRQQDRLAANEEILRIKGQMSDTASLCTRLRNERDDYKRQLEKQTKELEDTTDNMIAFSAEADSLRETSAQLEAELKTMKATARSYQQRSAIFEAKYEKSKNETLTLRKQVKSLHSPQHDPDHLDRKQSTSPIRKQSPSTLNRLSSRIQDRRDALPDLTRNSNFNNSIDNIVVPTPGCRKRSMVELEEPSTYLQNKGSAKRKTPDQTLNSSFNSLKVPNSPVQDSSNGIILPSLFGNEPIKKTKGFPSENINKKTLSGNTINKSFSNQNSSTKLIALGPKIRHH